MAELTKDVAGRIVSAFSGKCKLTSGPIAPCYRIVIRAGKHRVAVSVLDDVVYLDNYGTVTFEQLIELVALFDSW